MIFPELLFQGYWPGAIRTQGELEGLIARAKSQGGFSLHEVAASGVQFEFPLNETTTIKPIYRHRDELEVALRMSSIVERDVGPLRRELYLVDYNILQSDGLWFGNTRWMLFTDRDAAGGYASSLLSDVEFQAAFQRRLDSHFDDQFSKGWY